MKPPRLPTATVSVCVTPDEGRLIRDAAAAQGLKVSSWANTRTLLALSNQASRAAVAAAAGAIETTLLPRGSRSDRISMVMRVPDHSSLREAATGLRLTLHAFAQAALISTAERELRDMPAPQRRMLDAERKADRAAGSYLVSLPADLAHAADVEGLSATVRALVKGTAEQILAGNGPMIAAGATRLAAAQDGKGTVTVRLYVPEFEIRAVAFVLGMQLPALATALALKAAKALGVTPHA